MRRRRAQLRERAAEGRGADGRARRLHQRRQDDALQRADAATTRSRRTRCSSRSIRWCARCGCRTAASCSCPTRSASSIGCRTRSSRRSAPRSRKWPTPTCCCTSSTRRRPIASGRWRRSAACSRKSAPTRCRSLEVFNKCDQLDAGERGAAAGAVSRRAVRLGARPATAATSSSRRMEARLALDTARVTLEFDPPATIDRERIAQLYRLGRDSQSRVRGRTRVDRGRRAAPPARRVPVGGECRHRDARSSRGVSRAQLDGSLLVGVASRQRRLRAETAPPCRRPLRRRSFPSSCFPPRRRPRHSPAAAERTKPAGNGCRPAT